MSLENEEKPKPIRKKRKRKLPKIVEDSTPPNPIEPLLEEALTNFLHREANKKNKSIKNMKSLESLLDQYLNSFILIGYSRDTREFISLVNAKNEQSADSLSTALQKFIVNNAKSGPRYPPVF
jgi:hypothetical protein